MGGARNRESNTNTMLIFVTSILCLLFTDLVFAWGQQGHRVIADIAEERLTPETERKIQVMLQTEGHSHLNEIANWADKARVSRSKEYSNTEYPAPGHMARFPNDFTTPSTRSICKQFCAIQGEEFYLTVLRDNRKPNYERLLALKWVVHLVGDLHQPFHGSAFPAGAVKVRYLGQVKTLHDFWDVDIVSVAKKTDAELTNKSVNNDCIFSLSTDPRTWALESRDLVRDIILPGTPYNQSINNLPSNYKELFSSITECRLKTAGFRLSEILNEALRK